MKQFYVIICVVLLTISCDKLVEQNYHDGIYEGGLTWGYATWTVNGNEIIIDDEITGVTKIQCKQYTDRIEYTEPDGTIKILTLLPDGNLKQSEYYILERVKVNNKTNTKEDAKIHQIKTSNSTDNQIQITTESFLETFAIINDIFEEKGKKYVELDIISLEGADDPEDTYTINIINKNKKLRTFEVVENVTTEVCRDYLRKTKNTLIDNKNRLLIKNNKNPWDSIVMFNSNKGKITKVNLGCWS